jgi:hypothetical protein
MPWAFLPGRPDGAPDDPLAAVLGGGHTSAGGSPPWIRLFQLTSGHPWWLPWRHVDGGCDRVNIDWEQPLPYAVDFILF